MECYDERSKTWLTRAPVDTCSPSTLRHAYYTPTDPTVTGDNKEGNKEEVARSVETLALESNREEYSENYLAKRNTWVKEREAQGKGPWLHAFDDHDEVLNALLEFMASRCSVHNNQQSTVEDT